MDRCLPRQATIIVDSGATNPQKHLPCLLARAVQSFDIYLQHPVPLAVQEHLALQYLLVLASSG